MAYEYNCLAFALQTQYFIHALLLKFKITDCQNFIHKQYIRLHMNGNGKTEPHIHAGRIASYRHIDVRLKLRERNNAIKLGLNLLAGKSEYGAVKENIFTSGEIRMKTGAKLKQCRNFTVYFHFS
ncbi:hypothetical protein D3C78_1265950 [compost metagenome]